jgi:hypothetical protein
VEKVGPLIASSVTMGLKSGCRETRAQLIAFIEPMSGKALIISPTAYCPCVPSLFP